MNVKSIDMCSLPSELGAFILDGRGRLAAHRSLGGVEWMHAYSSLIDAGLSRVFELAVRDATGELGELRRDALEGVCLVATGGYGRCELSPFSDIDVAFVVSDGDDPQIDLLVKRAYRLLMDALLNAAGLKVGYAYRELNDLRDLPLEVQTALLDARCVAGSILLFHRFHAAVRDAITPAGFVLGHIEQRRLAAERWGSSPYTAEPNVKEGMGGLRDLQTARWIAQIAFDSPREDVWHTLRARGIVSDQEIEWVHDAGEFLARVRNALHIACGRANEVLSADRQEQITTAAGFPPSGLAMMRAYYRHAERVACIYDKAVAACCRQPLEIEPGMVAQSGELRVLDRGLLARNPEAAIRMFEHAMALRLKVGWETTDLVRAYIENLQRAKGPPSQPASRAFLRILSRPATGEILQVMARVGVLQWLIPEFRRVMYQVPGDAAHKLTVGAHSLEVARQLGSFVSGADGELAEVWTSTGEPELLFLAALLHDVGKRSKSGPHADAGASVVSTIALRLSLRPESAAKLEFLVRNHLIMSEVARLRDLSQKRTIQDLATLVDSAELLDMLYLLTVADLRSVGQAIWGEVQMRFLRELYHRTSAALRGSGPAHVDLERHRGRLARELSLADLPQAEVDEHCRAMPASYLLNTPLDDLASHIYYVRQARAAKPVVRLREDSTGQFTEIAVCTPDEPGLLAKIAGVLAALGVNIHAAQVFTRNSSDRTAIDLLYVDFEGRTLSQMKGVQARTELERVLTGKSSVNALWARHGRKPGGEIELVALRVMSHLSDEHTVVEVEAKDQPGLLYQLTSAISSLGWNIHSARISTWGARAHDAFYVTERDGSKLDGDIAENALRQAIAEHSQ